MLWGAATGALELRADDQGGVRLTGRFPYRIETELAPGRREVFDVRAFGDRIERGEDIHLLAGHDFEKPLASRAAGNLEVTDTDAALVIEARIEGGTSWARDFLAAHKSGLIRGLSPGFQVSPGGEKIENRSEGLLRTVTRAALFEISCVTKPAYPKAQIEARSWQAPRAWNSGLQPTLKRWRA